MGLIIVIGWIRSVFGVEIMFGFVVLSFWVMRLNNKTKSKIGNFMAREDLCFSFCIFLENFLETRIVQLAVREFGSCSQAAGSFLPHFENAI